MRCYLLLEEDNIKITMQKIFITADDGYPLSTLIGI
jgi:hypothetical protein